MIGDQQISVKKWVNTLPCACVTSWVGILATPDTVLQARIKRSLQESRCPDHIVNKLMENAHERRWPQGLQTLETRQMNRRQRAYDNPIYHLI